MNHLVVVPLAMLVFYGSVWAEDELFRNTSIVLQKPNDALQLKKGDELPVRMIVGDSSVCVWWEEKTYNRNPSRSPTGPVGKWVTRRDTITVRYEDIQAIRYERTLPLSEFERIMMTDLLWGSSRNEKFHWLTLKYAPGGQIQKLMLRLDKTEQREIRHALEDRSGKKIEVKIEDLE